MFDVFIHREDFARFARARARGHPQNNKVRNSRGPRAHLLWESHPPPPTSSSSPSPFSPARSVVPVRRPVHFVSAVPGRTATSSFAPRASLARASLAPSVPLSVPRARCGGRSSTAFDPIDRIAKTYPRFYRSIPHHIDRPACLKNRRSLLGAYYILIVYNNTLWGYLKKRYIARYMYKQ